MSKKIREGFKNFAIYFDDNMAWKLFLHCWSFGMEIHWYSVDQEVVWQNIVNHHPVPLCTKFSVIMNIVLIDRRAVAQDSDTES